MIIDEDEYLAHYGILRKSGRYPWGSGDNQSEVNNAFLSYVADLRAKGLSEVEIARGIGVSTTQLRAAKAIAKTEQKQTQINMAQRLKDKGLSNVAIGQRMGIPDTTVGTLLKPGAKDKADVLQGITTMLKDQVAEKTYVDVGSGVEQSLNISDTKLKVALAALKEEGYNVYYAKVLQLGTGMETSLKVLVPPGTTYSEFYKNRDNIKQINAFSDDGGRDFNRIQPPLRIDPKRVDIVYGDKGGAAADGVIYVRPGVQDVSLGKSSYAQVRIQVGDGHYLKGMAMYREDLPDGVDLLFNTNKLDTGNKFDAMKKVSDDPVNPFGSMIKRQLIDRDPNGKPVVTSAMNIVNEEGDWTTWSKNLSSQMLSKQSPQLARAQLNMAYERRARELDNILALTNPEVRKKLLTEFSDGADSAAVHLKAAPLPGQGSHIILPIKSIKPTEIYAPNYQNGERVVLIRHPHGGTFEIPELTVNNNHRESKRLLKDAKDAVGIHSSVAERLSGADFDGDTVIVIPNSGNKVKTTPALEGLKNFDPRSAYPAYEGMKPISPRTKQQEMGYASNLITDMTIKRASTQDLARAVRYSMVVIDSEKHNLDYRQAALDNGIRQLKERYQGKSRGGASTLISNAGKESKVAIPERKARTFAKGGPIDPKTGKKEYEPTGVTYVNSKGQTVTKTVRVPKLSVVDDVSVYSSGTPMERVYVEHANKLKSLANYARLQLINTPPIKVSTSAKKVYSNEVESLNAKLALAIRNRPLERQAQILANAAIKAKVAADPGMDSATLKKIKNQELETARIRTGAKKQRIQISPEEWDAIQAGAISGSRLATILDNADMDIVRELATPRDSVLMTTAKTNRAKAMLADGYTRAEVAAQLGVSLSTLDASTSEEG
jgi:hypothetical protein